MKHKAIIFDLDGTAIDSPNSQLPSEELVQTIAQLKDTYFLSAATGRAWSFAKPILQALQLSDPCVISAGTQICDPTTGDILWQKNIAEDAVHKILEVFNEYPEYKMLYNDYTTDDYYHGGIPPKDFSSNEPIYFLAQKFIPDEIALEVYEKLLQIPDITCIMLLAQASGARDFHLVNHAATKEHAIAELLKLLGVSMQDTIGIGDGGNDMHLFNAVHHKVAMGNAVPELKEAADEVIDTVEQDGLAKFLKTLSI